MFVPEEKISEVLNASDIVDVISDSVTLKKAGINYFGLCPFHSEKTPSFSVSPQKQIFHCFGCSAGGNALSFLMKQHHISFPEALNMLAKRYGITIAVHEISSWERQKIELKEELFRINSKVREYYASQLKIGSSSSLTMSYLEKRAITPEIIDELSIGYAPDRWDGVVSLLRKMRLSRSMAEHSGLVLKRKNSSGYYDRFRNRIMFPIFDVNMQVAGFGGRILDNTSPKYLNSPETPVYSKGKILYGLHVAKQHCRQKGIVYIVEGYFDFLSLYQSGIKNCVATLGTALTTAHIRLLKGYASKIFLVFDSDDAGVHAARRSVDLFVKESIELRIVVLPSGHDPDSFVIKYGAKAFESAAMSAMSVIDFLTEVAVKKYGTSIEGKVAILEDMKIHIAAIEESTARSLYVREIAHRLGIDEETVLEKVREQALVASKSKYTALNDGQQKEIGVNGARNTSVNKNSRLNSESEPREQQIISMMLQFPEIIDEVKKKDVLGFFYSSRLKAIGQCVLNVADSYLPVLSSSCDNQNRLVRDVMASAQNEADRELIASLAMMDATDIDNVLEKSLFLIRRIINVRKRNDSTLTHEIRKVELASKTKQIKNRDQGIKTKQDNDIDLTLELLRQRQMEIRKLRGYE
ncbi:MAG: DNA primase [Desulfamplus sp.]|nr:DNA primase [Desulfamplus sp.]